MYVLKHRISRMLNAQIKLNVMVVTRAYTRAHVAAFQIASYYYGNEKVVNVC